MNNSNEIHWPDSVWQEIKTAVLTEVGKVRIAQKVFPTTELNNHATEIPDEVINFKNFTIQEGRTKPFVEIYLEFALTNTQMGKELESKICKTLARMAAKAIALAEDTIIFQGQDAIGVLPANVNAELLDSTGRGLLGEASPDDADDDLPDRVSERIKVDPVGRRGLLYGENTFPAVTRGIAQLVRKAQAPPYALFLPTRVFADTFAPPGNESLVTTADRIRPLVEGGFYGTGTLPPDKGLLVALGGEPTCLYVGQEATTEFVRKQGRDYFFRVVDRIQFVTRDPRAYVLLQFLPVSGEPVDEPAEELVEEV